MFRVHSQPVIKADLQHGWQMVFWLGKAFDYRTPFRDALSEMVAILQPSETVRLELPAYIPDEDFVEGLLVVGEVALKTYYEYPLGYLALMSRDKKPLEAVTATLLPFVHVGSA